MEPEATNAFPRQTSRPFALEITRVGKVGEKKQNLANANRPIRPILLLTSAKTGDLARPGTLSLKLELDDQERRTVRKSLVERRARLAERTGDTTQSRAAQRSGLQELKAIELVLQKLRRAQR
jgi:hypothetical protein